MYVFIKKNKKVLYIYVCKKLVIWQFYWGVYERRYLHTNEMKLRTINDAYFL